MPARHFCRIVATPWPGVFATDIESSHQYQRHWHETIGIGVMLRGAHRSMSGRGVVDAHAGDVITNNPGEVHDGRPLGARLRRWRMVYMDPAVTARIWTDTGGRPVELTRPVIHDGALATAMRRLFQRLDAWSGAPDGPCGEALACDEALVLAFGRAFRRYSSAPPAADAPADVARVRARLGDDLRNPPSLGQLAALAGASKYQLLRRFHRAYGVTPHEWLRQARLERARARIQAGLGLAAVAADCGFADQSHMTRAFAAHFGFTPGALRARTASPQ